MLCPSISACFLCAVLIPATVLRAGRAQDRPLEHHSLEPDPEMGIFPALLGWSCSPPSPPSILPVWQGYGIAYSMVKSRGHPWHGPTAPWQTGEARGHLTVGMRG